MSSKAPKTQGSEWLYHSMAAFNGSGYADRSTPETFVKSYTLFKAWKKQKEAVQIVKKYEVEAHFYATHLVAASEPGLRPTEKNLARFKAFCDRMELLA